PRPRVGRGVSSAPCRGAGHTLLRRDRHGQNAVLPRPTLSLRGAARRVLPMTQPSCGLVVSGMPVVVNLAGPAVYRLSGCGSYETRLVGRDDGLHTVRSPGHAMTPSGRGIQIRCVVWRAAVPFATT